MIAIRLCGLWSKALVYSTKHDDLRMISNMSLTKRDKNRLLTPFIHERCWFCIGWFWNRLLLFGVVLPFVMYRNAGAQLQITSDALWTDRSFMNTTEEMFGFTDLLKDPITVSGFCRWLGSTLLSNACINEWTCFTTILTSIIKSWLGSDIVWKQSKHDEDVALGSKRVWKQTEEEWRQISPSKRFPTKSYSNSNPSIFFL